MCARGTGPCLTWRFSWSMNIWIFILTTIFHFWISEHLRTSLTSVRVKPINHPTPQKKHSLKLQIPLFPYQFLLSNACTSRCNLYSHYYHSYILLRTISSTISTTISAIINSFSMIIHLMILAINFPIINFLPPWSSNSQLIFSSISSSMTFEVFLLLMNNHKTKPFCSYYFSLVSNHLTIALMWGSLTPHSI